MARKKKEWYELVICSKCLCRYQFGTMKEISDELYCSRCSRCAKKSKTPKVKKTPKVVKTKNDKKGYAKPTKFLIESPIEELLPEPSPIGKDGKGWYAVQIIGNDNECAKRIHANAKAKGLGSDLTRCIVPRSREIHTMKSGKVVFRNKKCMPGYILVRCKLTPEVEECIKLTRGQSHSKWKDEETGKTHISSKAFSVVRILPYEKPFNEHDVKKEDFHRVLPQPLPKKEVDRFAVKPKPNTQRPINYDVQDFVVVVAGTYAGTKGHVVEILDRHKEDGKAKLRFRLLGANVEEWFNVHNLTKTL